MIVASDTIVAPATPPGRGGIGIVRISGSLVLSIAQTILKNPQRRSMLIFVIFFLPMGKLLTRVWLFIFVHHARLRVKIF